MVTTDAVERRPSRARDRRALAFAGGACAAMSLCRVASAQAVPTCPDAAPEAQKTAGERYAAGSQLLVQERWSEARAEIARALEVCESPTLWLALGRARRHEGRWKDAQDAFERALAVPAPQGGADSARAAEARSEARWELDALPGLKSNPTATQEPATAAPADEAHLQEDERRSRELDEARTYAGQLEDISRKRAQDINALEGRLQAAERRAADAAASAGGAWSLEATPKYLLAYDTYWIFSQHFSTAVHGVEVETRARRASGLVLGAGYEYTYGGDFPRSGHVQTHRAFLSAGYRSSLIVEIRPQFGGSYLSPSNLTTNQNGGGTGLSRAQGWVAGASAEIGADWFPRRPVSFETGAVVGCNQAWWRFEVDGGGSLTKLATSMTIGIVLGMRFGGDQPEPGARAAESP